MILVVDDDPAIVKVIRTALEIEGFDVLTAKDGVEAYKLVRQPNCKALVVDINMPRINGIALLLLMQAENIQIPAIVMAGFGDFRESEIKAFSNVVKFLQKPFELDTLVTLLRQHMRR